MMTTDTALTTIEEKAHEEGYELIAGVDEAGRGPLAGPVVAAACIIPRGIVIEGVDDSKKLSSEERERLYRLLVSHPQIIYSLGILDHHDIDTLNILQATLRAMALAVEGLSIEPDFLLIDGNQKPPTSIPLQTVVQGDSLSQSIAAASILAKRTRDQLMLEYHLQYPEYGFNEHKGYGTKKHLKAIETYGPCPIHRQSFAPIKSCFSFDEN